MNMKENTSHPLESSFDYSKQSNKPSWYEELEEQTDHEVILVSCTSGSSAFNEWYGFKDREQALELLSTFESQSVVDGFQFWDGEVYDREEFDEAMISAGFDQDNDYWSEWLEKNFEKIEDKLTPSEISLVCDAESPF